ncbi:hypothetical protein ColLi_01801 [Colletotrichum liriopes]|uniref:Uncharacterized protein n=1 Tax=Colletotrichum liriopes TaxID=708192 RepID=A0AA37GE18_9PEZI|nr:hypothetical protein ColLi_01801 [Colletotrichum liriopes]
MMEVFIRKIPTLLGSLDDARTDAKVTKLLALLPLGRVPLEQRLHDGQDLVLLDALAVQLVQALSVVAAAEVHVVRAVRLSDEGDLGEPRAGAAVGAARHAHDDRVLAQAVLLEAVLELGDEHGQVALRLGHGETAGREGDAGRGAEAQAGEVHVVELVLLHERLDGVQVLVGDVAEDQVLVAREAELALVHLCDLAQARLHLELGGVLDATVLDEEGEVAEARLVLLPAESVDVGLELEGALLVELLSPEVLDLGAEHVNAHVVDGVLETRVLAVLAVAVVALDEHDLLAGDVDLVRLDEAEHATDLGVEALEVAVLALDGDQTNVVSVDVGVVVGGMAMRLEVLDSVTGDLGLGVVLVRQPDLVVGGGRRQQVVADLLGAGPDLLVVLGLRGQRTAHDVTVDITAGGDGGHERAVDGLHGGPQLALDDTVELEGLTSGELHGLVAELVGNVVHLHPLLGSGDTAGQTATNHEGVGGLQAHGLALISDITVVLHVGTVELGELLVGGGDGTGAGVLETLGDGTTEEVGGNLDVLVGDGGRLLRETVDVVDAKGAPDLGLPLLVTGLVAIGVLVVTETDVGKSLTTKVGKDAVEVLGGLVVVDLVLLAGPVVTVTETEDGVVDVGEVKLGVVLKRVPQRVAVLGELTLTCSGGHKDNVLNRVVLHGHNLGLQAASLATVTKALGDGGGIAVVGGVEDREGGSEETLQQLVVGVLGLALLLGPDLSAKVLRQVGGEDGVTLHDLGKLVVAVQEGLELALDALGVKGEVGLALGLVGGVPAVQRPVADIDGLLGLLEDGQGRVGLAKVRKDLGVGAVDSGRSDVGVAEVHGVQANVLLAAIGVGGGTLRVGSRVNDEHVDVLARGQNVVHTRVAEIVSPGVGADEPQGLLAEKTLAGQQVAGDGGTISLETRNQVIGDLIRLLRIGLVGGPAGEPALGSIGHELVAVGSLLDLADKAHAALLAGQQGAETELGAGLNGGVDAGVAGLQRVGDVRPLAEQLVEDLGVRVLDLGLLEPVLEGLLGDLLAADLEVLDGRLGSQVLENAAQGLDDGLGVNVAKLVADDGLDTAEAALHAGENIDENGAPLCRLAVDLLEDGNALHGLGKCFGQSGAEPGAVQPRSENADLGEVAAAAGLVDNIAKEVGAGAEDEEAVLGVGGTGVEEGLVLAAGEPLEVGPDAVGVLENVLGGDDGQGRLDGGGVGGDDRGGAVGDAVLGAGLDRGPGRVELGVHGRSEFGRAQATDGRGAGRRHVGSVRGDRQSAVIGIDADSRCRAVRRLLEAPRGVNVEDLAHELGVLSVDGRVVVARGRGEEVDDTLAGAQGEGVCRQGHVLGLLQRLGLEKGPSRVADGCDGREVGEAGGLEGDVQDDGVVCQLVEVGDGRQEGG